MAEVSLDAVFGGEYRKWMSQIWAGFGQGRPRAGAEEPSERCFGAGEEGRTGAYRESSTSKRVAPGLGRVIARRVDSLG